MPAPRHLAYQSGDAEEQLLAIGHEDAARRILIIPPLFDEMNRVRHTLVEAMRMLGERGLATGLPDLPGCNESIAKLKDQSLSRWRSAAANACLSFNATHIFSVRGGCLIDDCKPELPIARLAPVKGKTLLNMLMRVRIAGDKESGVATSADELETAALAGSVALGGNCIGASMWAEAMAAVPATLSKTEEVKLSDINGSTLWLRAEPQHSAEMAAGLAAFLDNWSSRA